MKFEEKLKKIGKKELYDEYCSFIDLSLEDYMNIQKSLLKEQIYLWQKSNVGQKILKGREISTFEDFKKYIPLTTYHDYADILLKKDDKDLPAPATLWIETTWEGGTHPIKVAPYNKAMLETVFTNMCVTMMIATGKKKYDFDIKASYHMLYGLAPLPYATGLIPLGLDNQIGVQLLPPAHIANKLSFGERNKLGFKMGLIHGIDYFFGLGSVTYYVSQSLSKMGGGSADPEFKKELMKHPTKLLNYLNATKTAKREGRGLLPKDLFDIKGLVVAGTDNCLYRDELERMWGIKPLELFAGTEPTMIGTELHSREGLIFFPDACFYEFIRESDLEKQEDNPSYQLPTYTLDQVQPNQNYEIVISVLKGGAFMRYRVGDMYRCVSLKSTADQTSIPLFKYVDRVKDVIDIAGFTRITKNSIDQVIKLSKLDIVDYIAKKEIDENNRPYMHMYVEVSKRSSYEEAISVAVLKDHLTVYFKYFDQDYDDLKKILGIDPLKITLLKVKSLSTYPHKIRRMNPSLHDIEEFMRFMNQDLDLQGGSLHD